MVEDLSRSLGHLEGTVDGLSQRVDTIAYNQADIQKKISEMHDVFMQARGGMRMLVIASSVSGAIGAIVAWAVTIWGKLHT